MGKNEHPYFRSLRRVEDYWTLVSQTAEYRYRIRWEGGRRIMSEKRFDPLSTIQVFCEHGDDIACGFILPDISMVRCDFREDRLTRQAVSITHWEMVDGLAPGAIDTTADIWTFGVDVLHDTRLRDAFDRAVMAYYEFHFKIDDRPLPKLRDE
jgi:hypothetical protein